MRNRIPARARWAGRAGSSSGGTRRRPEHALQKPVLRGLGEAWERAGWDQASLRKTWSLEDGGSGGWTTVLPFAAELEVPDARLQ